MHPGLGSSRAIFAAAALALAPPAEGQAPPRPAAASAADAALLEVGRDRLRGEIRATARAALPGGEAALLVAHAQGGKVGFTLLVVAGDGSGPLAVAAGLEIDPPAGPGAPGVALSTTSLPIAPGALAATVAMKGPDGTLRERTLLYRYAGGRLTQLHALPPAVVAPPGSAQPGIRYEAEALSTSTRGYRDLRVRARIVECAAADCLERQEVTTLTFDGARYAERPHAIPFLDGIVASSELAERGALVDHSAAAAVDGRLDTAWCEGAPGPGWFEKLTLSFLPAQRVRTLAIAPGHETGDAFSERSRPRRIRVLLPDGRKVEAELADAPGVQRIALPAGERVFGLTVVIVDVYKGKREDACITELELEVEP